jgi:hypothetical protein
MPGVTAACRRPAADSARGRKARRAAGLLHAGGRRPSARSGRVDAVPAGLELGRVGRARSRADATALACQRSSARNQRDCERARMSHETPAPSSRTSVRSGRAPSARIDRSRTPVPPEVCGKSRAPAGLNQLHRHDLVPAGPALDRRLSVANRLRRLLVLKIEQAETMAPLGWSTGPKTSATSRYNKSCR